MSVRVIRAHDAPSSNIGAPFVATARRIEAERWRARLEGESTLVEARRQAQAIVDHARKQADDVRAAAHAEGLEAGRREAMSIVTRARVAEASAVDAAIDVVVHAARAVAERAVARSIAVDDAALAGWAREALAPLQGARRIVVRGNASTIDRLRPQLQTLGPRTASVIELAVDASLVDGVVHARSEIGEIRLEIAAQMAAMTELVREAIATAVRGARG